MALFDKAPKLGKGYRDTYNWGGWLILLDLLKKWVAEAVASELHDFSLYPLSKLRKALFAQSTQNFETSLGILSYSVYLLVASDNKKIHGYMSFQNIMENESTWVHWTSAIIGSFLGGRIFQPWTF